MKVVKHARYGRDVEADPDEDVPDESEEEGTEDDVSEDTEADREGTGGESEYADDRIFESAKRVGLATHRTSPEYNDLITTDNSKVIGEVSGQISDEKNSPPIHITEFKPGKRAIRYKHITYKKKVIRSSICPNGKRPSYYDCTCY